MEIKGKDLLEMVNLQIVQEGDTITIEPKVKEFPSMGDSVYYVSLSPFGACTVVATWDNSRWLADLRDRGLIWKTRDEAKEAAKRIDAVLMPALEQFKNEGGKK